MHTKEPIVAFEVRFLSFNIWGELVKVLSGTQVVDLPANLRRTEKLSWKLHSGQ